MPEKVVLAYSGGLDTSVAIQWIADKYNMKVIALTIDVGQVQQVFFNLIKNAAEAIKDSGKNAGSIEISAVFHPEKTEIELKVKDDGPGIRETATA